MTEFVVYTKDYCPYCKSAKALLKKKGASFREIDITDNDALAAEMVRLSQRRTVPQIFFGDRHIGGSDDLYALADSGELDALLRQPDAP